MKRRLHAQVSVDGLGIELFVDRQTHANRDDAAADGASRADAGGRHF